MKLKIDYSKAYPSKIDEARIDGLYEILLEHRGLFIDYYYKNVDTISLSHIFFKMDNYNTRKDNFIFVATTSLNIQKYIFWVYKDSTIQICSEDFLPIFNILVSFVREYKITNLLN